MLELHNPSIIVLRSLSTHGEQSGPFLRKEVNTHLSNNHLGQLLIQYKVNTAIKQLLGTEMGLGTFYQMMGRMRCAQLVEMRMLMEQSTKHPIPFYRIKEDGLVVLDQEAARERNLLIHWAT